jgi:hypothetical protein
MQIAASEEASRLCISSIRKSAPVPVAWATSPISRTRSVRSCSGSPESAIPEAASTSSFSCTPEGTATLNALTMPSARSTRSLIRWRRLISRRRRVAMRAKVTRKSGWEPTSWTPVVAQPASLASTSSSISQHGLADPAQPGVDEASLVGAGGEALDQRPEVLEVAIAAGEGRGLAAGAGGVGVVALLHTVSKAFYRPFFGRQKSLEGSLDRPGCTLSKRSLRKV